MAEVLQIVDSGSVLATINLLNASGFNLTGWIPAIGRSKESLHELVTDQMDFKLTGSSQNNLATQLQALERMLKKAWQYHNTDWQTSPVYLQAQGSTETGARYAVIHNYIGPERASSIHRFFVVKNKTIPDLRLRLTREAGWRDAAPNAYTSALTLSEVDAHNYPTTSTRWPVSNNHNDEGSFDYIYSYDDSEAAFSSNLNTTTAFDYFVVSGSTPAVDDLVYFGNTFPFFGIGMNIDPGNFNQVILFEYWDGDSWEELAIGEYTVHPAGQTFRATGIGDKRYVLLNVPSDWAANEINGQTVYWIRFHITVDNTFTSAASQQTDKVHMMSINGFEMAATQIDGDMSPLLQIIFAGHGGVIGSAPFFNTISRIVCGVKSNAVSSGFSSMHPMNAGFAAHISPWTRTLRTDATEVTDVLNAFGESISVSFGTETLVERVNLVTTTANTIKSYFGTYRVFVRCQQVGGSAGNTAVQARIVHQIGSAKTFVAHEVKTEEKALAAADAGIEVVDLGILKYPGSPISSTDEWNGKLFLSIYASRSTGSATLTIYDLVLIPINEASFTIDAPVLETGNFQACIFNDQFIELDAGIVRQRVAKTSEDTTDTAIHNKFPVATWNLHGKFPIIEPSKAYEFHFLLMKYNGAFGTGPFLAPMESSMSVEIRAHDRYTTLRGAD